MILRIVVISILLVMHGKAYAQKSCIDSLCYYDERADSFVNELKHFVEGKDSTFIFYSVGLVDLVGISAYKSNGKIFAKEFIFDYKNIDTRPLDKNGSILVEEFYSKKYFKNAVTTNRFFGDDAGHVEAYLFLYNRNCWYLDNTYLLDKNNNMQKWRYKINEYAWKRHDQIFDRKRKESKKD